MAGFTHVHDKMLPLTAPQVPAVAFALYQLQFATVTGAIIFGAAAGRFRLLPGLLFVFIWTTLVYDPVAYWTWGAHGWLKNMACLGATAPDATPCGIGSYDYAGGGPVHVASGFAGLAYCLIIGKRKGYSHNNGNDFKAHSVPYVLLGTALLWFGWFGFNGGSAIASTPRAAMAALVTVVSAACGGLSWALTEYLYTKKLSAIAFCSGVVAGLVAITPGSGFVAPWAAIIFGLSSGVLVCYSVHLKHVFKVDDALDAFGVHGVGGVWGNILTGIFAQKWVGGMDGSSINGGWIEGNVVQMGYQIGGTVAIAAYSFALSYIILYIIDKIPGLQLRSSNMHETHGNDMSEMGEVAYEVLTTMSQPMMTDLKAVPKIRPGESSSTMMMD